MTPPARTALVPPVCALACWLTAMAALAALAASPALAAGHVVSSDAESRFQRDLAACQAAGYIGDRPACRRDAAAARADRAALQGDVEAGQYLRNALKRCDRLPPPDRVDCRARMQGEGTTSGSAAAGGIYRERVTTVPAAAASAASAASR